MGSRSTWKAHVAQAFVQSSFAGFHVITKVALNAGVNQIVLCVYRSVLALLILSPAAFFREKTIRPPISYRLLLSFFCLGFTGIYANQLLFILGLTYTSPAYASATQPAIPVLTFLLAAVLGTEKVNFKRMEGWGKVGGIIVCVFGALVMALYRGPPVVGTTYAGFDDHGETNVEFHPDRDRQLKFGFMMLGLNRWQLGLLCLIGNCTCMSIYLVFQARLLTRYPATLSLTAYSYFFAVLSMALTGLLGTSSYREWALTRSEIIAVLYGGIVASALNYGLQTWANKIIGPPLVALYYPVQPVASAILSRIFLGSPIYLGSIFGGLLIIAGLYMVTWATYSEKQSAARIDHANQESEPLMCED